MKQIDRIGELKQKLKALNAKYAEIGQLVAEERAEFGRKLNQSKQKILTEIARLEQASINEAAVPIDVTAWSGTNEPMPEFYAAEMGSKHPLMSELDRVAGIYQMMGFDVVESRQLDDEYHMFDSLNFAKEQAPLPLWMNDFPTYSLWWIVCLKDYYFQNKIIISL